MPDLRAIFDEWYNHKLKTTVFPQYKDMNIVKQTVAKAAPKGSAYEELQNMIGLKDAKAVIQKALNYYKMQKLYEEKGIKKDTPAMHMVFSGNPGTAKTTVARLFTRIMKDNGLLSKGQLIGKRKGVTFDAEATAKLEAVFDAARKQSDFGNGRYARNLIEQAKMNQASRLLECDFADITTEEITTIKAVDIVVPDIREEEKRRIGFAC